MPQLHTFPCPSCGAQLSDDVGAEPSLTCPSCGTRVDVPAALRASDPAPAGMNAATQDADKLAEIRQLARNGWKVEAIRLYRATFRAGRKEANDAVKAMAAEPADAPPATRARSGSTQSRRPDRQRPARGVSPRAGCAIALVLLLVACIAMFVLAMLFGAPFRLSGSYTQALDAARADSDVIEAFGGRVEPSWLPITGEISCEGSTCTADYTIPIYSARKSGYIEVYSSSEGVGAFDDGVWTLNASVVVYGGPTVNLTSPPAIPTPGAAQLSATSEAIEQATLDAQADLDARATATAQARDARATQQAATAAAQTEATAQALRTTQAAWPAILAEPFAGNGRGWPVGLTQDAYIAVTSSITNGTYLWTVTPKKGNAYLNLLPTRGVSLTDFSAAVTLRFVRGEPGDQYAYGLVFRHVNDDYGFFGLCNDGRYRVLVVYHTGIYQHIEMSSLAIRTGPGQANRIAVQAAGSDILFLINDQVVWQLNEDLARGEAGLGVDVMTAGPAAQVEFSDLDVRAPAGP